MAYSILQRLWGYCPLFHLSVRLRTKNLWRSQVSTWCSHLQVALDCRCLFGWLDGAVSLASTAEEDAQLEQAAIPDTDVLILEC